MTDQETPAAAGCIAIAIMLLFGRLFPLCFILSGGFVVWNGIEDYQHGQASHSWPSVQGWVQESKIRSVRSHNSDGPTRTHYAVQVVYKYEIEGNEYYGSKIRFGAMTHNQKNEAVSEHKKYLADPRVTVFYNPDDRNDAVLVPGIGGGVWISLLIGGVFVLVGSITAFLIPNTLRILGKKIMELPDAD